MGFVVPSLATTIKQIRPELINQMIPIEEGTMISNEPPDGYFAKHVVEIEDIGEPVNPCFFTNSRINPTNW